MKKVWALLFNAVFMFVFLTNTGFSVTYSADNGLEKAQEILVLEEDAESFFDFDDIGTSHYDQHILPISKAQLVCLSAKDSLAIRIYSAHSIRAPPSLSV